MREIILSNGQITLVDDQDYDYLNKYNWSFHKQDYTTYAYRGKKINGKYCAIMMHIEIALRHGIKPGPLIDHKDGNGLNNQSNNLRRATKGQNSANSYIPKGISGYKGVSWNCHRQKWDARIKYKKISTFLGYYDDLIEAALAYDSAARYLYKEFAKTNF
jgi:hypothetical protein